MRRRDFISLLGAAATLCSIQSRAQQPSKTYLIGYLTLTEIPYLTKAWKDGMRELGYVEGHNLRVALVPKEKNSAVSAISPACSAARGSSIMVPT